MYDEIVGEDNLKLIVSYGSKSNYLIKMCEEKNIEKLVKELAGEDLDVYKEDESLTRTWIDNLIDEFSEEEKQIKEIKIVINKLKNIYTILTGYVYDMEQIAIN